MGIYKANKPMFPKVVVRSAPMSDSPALPCPSFHPLYEGLQHALCPNRTFRSTLINRAGIFRVFSLFWHYPRVPFVWFGLTASTSLHPFAPRALPRFFATMGALTPARPALRTLARGNELPTCPGQVSLL